MNKAMLVGHVGVKPTLGHLPSGLAIAKFTLATKSRNIGHEDDWHEIVAYSTTAENVFKTVKVGQLLSIDGYVRTAKYAHGKLKGIILSKAEIVIDRFEIQAQPKPKEAEVGALEAN